MSHNAVKPANVVYPQIFSTDVSGVLCDAIAEAHGQANLRPDCPDPGFVVRP
jgi:hypothetical protein